VLRLLVAAIAVTAPVTVLRLQSPAFKHTGRIPAQYTCDGKDLSPPLEWGQPPAGTKRIAIVVQDPTVDPGPVVHWVLYDLPGSWTGVPAGVARRETLPSGARQGRNDFGSVGYRGPCPAPGKSHDYWYRVYALDGPLTLPPRPSGRDVLEAMDDHTVRVAELMGTYSR